MRKATIIGLFTNIFLAIIKIIAAVMTGSIAIISDAINSILDIISSGTTFIAVKLSKKESNKRYPFGYKRAEPMAALFIAILAGILAFEIFRSAVVGLINGGSAHAPVTALPVIILSVAIIVKIIISEYYRKVGKRNDSPALMASAIDFRNDILCTAVALIGYVGTSLKVYYLDDAAAIIVAGIIFYSGYQMALLNIDYLMGKSPDDATLFEIRRRALAVTGVNKVKDVKAHYVGNYIHVEVEIIISKNHSAEEMHATNHAVKAAIEGIYHIDKAFVHIEFE